VRIIAASNRCPFEAVAEGRLREDLLYRLNVFPLQLPPLRERLSDVPLLAEHFLQAISAREGQARQWSPQALRQLERYHWPGNVRELEHVISRAAIKAVSHGASRNEIVTLGAKLLDLSDGGMDLAETDEEHDAPAPSGPDQSLRDAVDACQRQAIRRALAAHQGNWAVAARALDVDPSNLHKLARRLGLKP
jgi:anaerobic nitric oxide reductase transcription regulator